MTIKNQQPTQKKKRKNLCQQINSIVKPNLDKPASQITCEGDMCSLKLPSSPPSSTHAIYTKFGTTEDKFKNSSMCHIASARSSFFELLPQDFYENLKEAAKKGMLLSFLTTLNEAVVSQILTARNYPSQRIYWINQALKAFTLIAGGMAIGKTLASPLVNLFLIKGLGACKDTANGLTTASLLTLDILLNPLTVSKVVTVGAVASMSLLTSRVTQACYQAGQTLTDRITNHYKIR